MRFCIESKYFSPSDGAYREVRTADTADELLHQLRKAMDSPGWSDSVLINANALPGPAAEDWRKRAASSREPIWDQSKHRGVSQHSKASVKSRSKHPGTPDRVTGLART